MWGENIEHLTKTNNNFAPNCFVYHLLPAKNFNGPCLINNISIPKKVINPYIFYGLGLQLEFLNTDFTWGNCLFGSVKLTENADLVKDKHTSYGIGFDCC